MHTTHVREEPAESEELGFAPKVLQNLWAVDSAGFLLCKPFHRTPCRTPKVPQNSGAEWGARLSPPRTHDSLWALLPVRRGATQIHQSLCQGPPNGGVSNGGVSRSGLVLPFLSFFVPFWDFADFSGIFPICSAMVRGFSRFVLVHFLGLLRAPTRNSPERVRDTIWTFPEKSGKPPGLETPRFSFSQLCGLAGDIWSN